MIFDGEKKKKIKKIVTLLYPFLFTVMPGYRNGGNDVQQTKQFPLQPRAALLLIWFEEQGSCLQQGSTPIVCKLHSYKYTKVWVFLHCLFDLQSRLKNLLRTGAVMRVSELQVRTESLLDQHSWQDFSDSLLVLAGTCTCWGSCKTDNKLSSTEQLPASEKLWSSA